MATSRKKPAASLRLDPSRQWSIDELAPHLPAVSAASLAALRKAVLGAHTDDELVTLGASFRTEDILAAVPGFLVGALLAIDVLGKPP
jgi:hypothetical protein